MGTTSASSRRPLPSPGAHPVPPVGQAPGPAPSPTSAPDPVAPAARPLLEIPSNPLRDDLALAESALLRADTQCVPFHALREPLLAEVLSWVESDATRTVAMQLRIGEGGSGKTRLMIEACRRLEAQGWCAGFLRSAETFASLEFAHLLHDHPAVFVVIDYAETRRQTLVALLRTALKAQAGNRVRILLLARAAGDWWDRLPDEHADLEPFLTGRAVSGPYRMPPVAPDTGGRAALFSEAQHAFAEALGRTPRPGVPDLSAAHFGQVLFIHLSALAVLADQRPETADGLLDATLRREARYWHQAVADRGLPQTAARGLEQAVALVTLVNGARSSAGARGLIDRCPALRESDQHTRDGIHWIARSFYPLDGGIDALRPDILGERLVARESARDDALLDLVLGPQSDAETRTAALTVLTRLAQHSAGADIWLRRGLGRHLDGCAVAAVNVAVEAGDPGGRILAEFIDAAPARTTRPAMRFAEPPGP